MTFQPGIAAVAALVADPAREAMLVALADGRALPAGELAASAGVSAQSASRHLKKLVDGGVLNVWSQGRWRYYRLAGSEVAAALESLSLLANRTPKMRSAKTRRGPPAELCFARRCYDHLAGELGVALASGLLARGLVSVGPGQQEARLTRAGAAWCAENAIPAGDLKLCMDWTERRPHLAGPAAKAMLRFLAERGFVQIPRNGRALRLTPQGRAWMNKQGLLAETAAAGNVRRRG